MKKSNRFTKGSGVYKCRCCGHMTRDTGGDGAMLGTCDTCADLASYENLFQDGEGGTLSKSTIENLIAQVAYVYSKDDADKTCWNDLLVEIIKECKIRDNRVQEIQAAMDDYNYVGNSNHY